MGIPRPVGSVEIPLPVFLFAPPILLEIPGIIRLLCA